jgi:flagellar basal-body rod protein FlgB
MFGPLGNPITRYLDLLAVRQRLVGANLANIDTPGYKTRDIDFHFEFMAASSTASSTSPPQVIEPADQVVKNDGNDVSLNRETRLLAENALRFNAATALLKGEMRMVRRAMSDGRGS